MSRRAFPGVEALILAAGQGRRMGGELPKLLLPLPGDEDGTIVLEGTLRNALEAGFDRVRVVIGPRRRAFWPLLGRYLGHPALQVTINPDWAEGRGASIRAGVLHRDPQTEHLLILCGDQPGIGAGLLRRLTMFHLEGDFPASHPVRADGEKGYPVIWSRPLFERLEELEGDRGGLPLLRDLGDRLGRLPLRPEEERTQGDLDTPEDFKTWPGTTHPSIPSTTP